MLQPPRRYIAAAVTAAAARSAAADVASHPPPPPLRRCRVWRQGAQCDPQTSPPSSVQAPQSGSAVAVANPGLPMFGKEPPGSSGGKLVQQQSATGSGSGPAGGDDAV